MHTRPHPLSGFDVTLAVDDAPATPLRLDDWLDREPVDDLPTALVTHSALEALWDEGEDADVVYGHIGSLGVVVHCCEIAYVTSAPPSPRVLLAVWESS